MMASMAETKNNTASAIAGGAVACASFAHDPIVLYFIQRRGRETMFYGGLELHFLNIYKAPPL
ncbi:hypothetical protein JCGZ_18340 [Jatropha curcas]|uniref:Uncharacterized protein n=1 Tax=Jatropha curcas TaxID=180498 RepID=A0A067KC53_JATCU|nr:hypothetical protein JCGZ_18340 [Jatropha curcas]